MKRNDEIERIGHVLQKRRQALIRALGSDPSSLQAGMWTGIQPVGALDKAEVEVTAQLTELESREFQLVADALERMRRGRYGVCEGCGDTIPLTRLNAMPHTPFCIRCQREVERQELLETAASDEDNEG